ncbi:TPM domain-containing protein [Methylocystis sp. IM3]|uniref:TPM domain-containing protein n=1 Tax=unclassified Methylocystis TaxID=2625913 RepID=UPI0030F5D04B
MRAERSNGPAGLHAFPPRILLAAVFILLTAFAFAAPAYPELTGRVVDQANVVPEAERATLQKKLKDLEDKSGIQLVVATIRSLEGGDIETYANGLFRYWKLGEAKKNNGVLFLVAPSERKMRIEVGYGLEGTLTDALSKIILATAVAPKFKAGDYGAGIERGVDGIIEVLSGDAAEWVKKARPQPTPFDEIVPFIIFALFIFIFIMMARSAGRPGQGRRYRRGGPTVIFLPPGGGWGDGGSFGGSSWDGGGGGGFDGFSGGGGDSGGGGASGDW